MRKSRPALVFALPALMGSASYAATPFVLGDWEGNSSDSWIDWTTQSGYAGGVTNLPAQYTFSNIGATLNSSSLLLTQSGYRQSLAVKLEYKTGAMAAFFQNTALAIDITLPATTQSGFSQLYEVALNAPGWGFKDLTTNPVPQAQWGWGAGGGPQQTYTVVLDYTTALASISPSASYAEFIFATNNDSVHNQYYFDNARLISTAPVSLKVDINGGDSSQPRPSHTGWESWGGASESPPLPTSGSTGNGNVPEGNYPNVSQISKNFSASGVTTTVRGVDYVASGAPAVVNDSPKVNSHDVSLPGRTLSNTGATTRDDVYRDYVSTEPGSSTASNGTNHRMEIQFDNLKASTTYKLTLYAYENTNVKGANVFTDVTTQPLITLPTADATATGGTFVPSDDRTANTQYAPAGQYLFSDAVPTNPNDRALTLYVTSDANGKLILAETTVLGLSNSTISGGLATNPVLNGYELLEVAATGWTGTGSSWNTDSNWSTGSAPNSLGIVAKFGTSTASHSLSIDSPVTVGTLDFADNSAAYTIGGSATLTIDDASASRIATAGGSMGRAAITVESSGGSHTINAPVVLGNDTTVNVTTTTNTLTLNNLQPTKHSLRKQGGGTLAVNNLRLGQLEVFFGAIRVLPNGTNSGVSVVTSLNPGNGGPGGTATGRVNLTNNRMIVRGDTTPAVGAWNSGSSSYSGVLGWVAFGRHGGAWDQQGIITDIDDNTAGPTALITLGVATGAQVKGLSTGQTAMWSGQTVNPNDTLIMYTYAGDANLSGKINADDYFQIDSNYNKTADASKSYFNGDFNYDGQINGDDYFIIDQNFANQGTPFSTGSTPGGVSAVPEPATSVLLIGAGAVILRRRRHTR